DFQKALDEAMQYAELLKPMMADVAATLHDLRKHGKAVMFEGAQGSLLGDGQGTYRFVTSSNTPAGGTAPGAHF
ncbi:adenylosuccinate synthetase, partial [Pseudomonas aeruginosa]